MAAVADFLTQKTKPVQPIEPSDVRWYTVEPFYNRHFQTDPFLPILLHRSFAF